MEASRIVDSPEEEKTKERDVRKKVYRSEKSWPKRTVTENEERGSTVLRGTADNFRRA